MKVRGEVYEESSHRIRKNPDRQRKRNFECGDLAPLFLGAARRALPHKIFAPTTSTVTFLTLLTLPPLPLTANITNSGAFLGVSYQQQSGGLFTTVSTLGPATGPVLKDGVGRIAQVPASGVLGANVIDLTLVGFPNIDEAVPLPLALLLDDGSFQALSGSEVFVQSADPLLIFDGDNYLTDPVLAEAPLSFDASAAGFDRSFAVTVLDSDPDNFGNLAKDGLPDNWQLLYFALESPPEIASAGVDPDFDGRTNRFEYLTGTIPIDLTSRFTLTAEFNEEGLDPAIRFLFSPFLAERVYTVERDVSGLLTDYQTAPAPVDEETLGPDHFIDIPLQGAIQGIYRIRIGEGE